MIILFPTSGGAICGGPLSVASVGSEDPGAHPSDSLKSAGGRSICVVPVLLEVYSSLESGGDNYFNYIGKWFSVFEC